MLSNNEALHLIPSMEFFEQSVDLWMGFASGHMGPQMYQHHTGVRGKQSLSGVYTWDEHAKWGSLPNLCRTSLNTYLPEVAKAAEKGLPIVEFGPGGLHEAKKLIEAFHCKEYKPVDCSLEIYDMASQFAKTNNDCRVNPIIADFFSGDNGAFVDSPALGVQLGSTISNIPGPVPALLPHHHLVQALKNLIKTIPFGGQLFIQVDTCQDEKRNVAFYSEPWHKLFGVNHIYRMAEELPMNNFDPNGFEYFPIWHQSCSLLAHTVRAVQDQEFQMGILGEINVRVKKGEIFHYNNSYKYPSDFFEACAAEAGLTLISKWGDEVLLYLFDVPAVSCNSQTISKRFLASAISHKKNDAAGSRIIR